MSGEIKYKNIKYIIDSYLVHMVSQIYTGIICVTAYVLAEHLQKTKVNVFPKVGTNLPDQT